MWVSKPMTNTNVMWRCAAATTLFVLLLPGDCMSYSGVLLPTSPPPPPCCSSSHCRVVVCHCPRHRYCYHAARCLTVVRWLVFIMGLETHVGMWVWVWWVWVGYEMRNPPQTHT